MSADPSDPDELTRWFTSRGLGDASTFGARRDYRAYLVHHLERAAAHAEDGAVDVVHDTAIGVDLSADRPSVVLGSGRRLGADRVVLASGNAPPGVPGPLRTLHGHPAWIDDPWAPGAIERVAGAADVLLVGAGLTTVDIAITVARSGDARLVALSRHGLLPRAHLPDRPQHDLAIVDLARDVGDLPGLTQRLRRHAVDAAGDGDDWRDVIDSVRPFVNALWQRADEREQRTFLTHLARYWDIHRHRMSPPTAARLDALLASGRLTNRRGRVVAAAIEGGRVRLDVRADGEALELRPDVVVNCTGPGRSWQPPANPVVADLVDRGIAVPDAHGIGLATTSTGHLIGRDGARCPSVLVIGPPRRGTLFETTAVPELRSQALHIADQIVVDPGGPG